MAVLSLLSAAREEPDRLALIAAGGELYTFADLARRTTRALGWLDRQLPAPLPRETSTVAFVPSLDVASLVLLYALIERKTTALLLHPRLTERERRALLDDAQPSLVISDPAGVDDAAPGEVSDGDGEDDVESTLAILYTSGTTGKPKGAMLSRRAFLASAAASERNLGWRDDDRWLLPMPLAHVGGLSIVLRCLIGRRCVVLPDPGCPLTTDQLRRDQVTLASLVPTMLKRWFDAEAKAEAATRLPPSSLRAVLLGGAAPSSSLLEEAARRHWPVLTTYGLTEACSQVTTQRYGTRPSAEQGSGLLLSGVEARIRDDDQRILLRGPTLMTGYFGRDPLPLGTWFETEDFGRFDHEGRLHVLGRSQDLIVTGGENVYPLEVERALEAIDGIDAAAVFPRADETWGDLVCAALVLAPNANRENIAKTIETDLAAHKRPRRIAIVECLPLTEAGKLDRQALATIRIDPKGSSLFP